MTPAAGLRELVQAFYARIWNERDTALIPAVLAEDFTFRGSLGAERRGHAGFAEYLDGVHRALGEYRCDILDLVVDGRRAFARTRFGGVHRGELLGHAPTGRRVEWQGAALFTERDGRISDLWVLGDLHALLARLERNARDEGLRLYGALASWWPLLSAPEEYAEEAGLYRRVLAAACDRPPASVLELGSGGGNNAAHLKRHFRMTLVDPSPGMLEVSRALNPECEHVQGDMRTIRLGREFDAVFVHDAICYMATRADLRAALETAYVHVRPGGAALFAPDHVRESFAPGAECGGRDGGGRGLRYLAWVSDPDPSDSAYVVDYALLLRGEDGAVRVEHDRHVEGLFSRAEWLDELRVVGFEAECVPLEHSERPGRPLEVFIGRRPSA